MTRIHKELLLMIMLTNSAWLEVGYLVLGLKLVYIHTANALVRLRLTCS